MRFVFMYIIDQLWKIENVGKYNKINILNVSKIEENISSGVFIMFIWF